MQIWGTNPNGEGSLAGPWAPGMVMLPALDFGRNTIFLNAISWYGGSSLPVEELGEIHVNFNPGPDINENGDPFGTGRNQRVWIQHSFWYIDVDSLGHVVDTVKDDGSGHGDTSRTIRH